MLNPLYVITGAPGTGKTSILDELSHQGYLCHPEVARSVIKNNMDAGINVFPWNDIRGFHDLVLDKMISESKGLDRDSLQFFDRGMVDVIGYMKNANEEVPEYYHKALLRMPYAKKVFYLPFWDDIYENDIERKEEMDDAKQIGDALRRAYLDEGFEVVEVPFGSIKERVDFILKKIH